MNKKKIVSCGNVLIGEEGKVIIQSMTNTDTKDVQSTVNQIKRLQDAGCQIVRVAVLNEESAYQLAKIKSQINIPLIADIHFDYKLAIISIDQGVDGIRINPGNIGSFDRLKKVVDKAKEKNIKIRVGVNGGSLEKDILQKYKKPTAQALVESALRNVKLVEDLGFYNIVISLKSSDVRTTVEAYELISKETNYPLHVGVTESGSVKTGTIKSSIGIGSLLLKGIGDTIRVSLTGDPVEEIFVAKEILKDVDLLDEGIKLTSCPTCGRCRVDLVSIVNEFEKDAYDIKKNLKVAIMGCAVNGPGEAKEADLGIACGVKEGLLFKKGKILRKVKEEDLLKELKKEIELY
ncbi:MAG: flavodoxin-dependent (E)-4-hydroxy-3-methylbut-2-enyl-diphosphate synthase [Peptostreptococcaceae bacterium]|jgi:(E)-4-hydroxy-3-methylbut-2-enyl-diphosphate synthase|nr:flavodoxin-dependent (E)-4-hydroxy-3-methylbut-2-enyl-diphosphate synthase [Peptostreptococcaceae bacterium]